MTGAGTPPAPVPPRTRSLGKLREEIRNGLRGAADATHAALSRAVPGSLRNDVSEPYGHRAPAAMDRFREDFPGASPIRPDQRLGERFLMMQSLGKVSPWLLAGSLLCPPAADGSTRWINQIPDLTQTEVRGEEHGDGQQDCGRRKPPWTPLRSARYVGLGT